MLTQLTVRDYAAKLASGAPTPGGGSAAGLAGALGAALAEMAGNFTVGKPKFAEVEADVQRLLAALEEQRLLLLDLTDADAEAYAKVGAAYGLARATEYERMTRDAAIEDALKSAAAVPLAITEACAAVIAQLDELRCKCNPNLLSDVACAAEIALAALRCAWLNVEINAASVKDAAWVEETRSLTDERLAVAETIARQVFTAIAQSIRKP